MNLFDLVAVSSSLSLIAGVCILLQAWCLLTEVKDRKGFWLAAALLTQFAVPLGLAWLLRHGVLPPSVGGLLLELSCAIIAAAGVLTGLYVLIVNRHRIPDLTVYAVWCVLFSGVTYYLQSIVCASFTQD